MTYWTLDYVNWQDGECELVYDDQLYKTEDEAKAAREATGRPDLFDVNWYTYLDLEEDVYGCEILVDEKLKVHPVVW